MSTAARDNRILEGPLSPAELVEILQRTLEEQGLAFGSAKAKHEEKIGADHRIREEQDAAYLASLQIDKEKERLSNLPSKERVQKPVEAHNTREHGKQGNNYVNVSKQNNKVSVPTSEKQDKANARRRSESQATQILIRFPNGERREHSFLCNDKIQSIFSYIDSLGLPGYWNYRLISNFPRKAYGVDQMRMTLKDLVVAVKEKLEKEHHSLPVGKNGRDDEDMILWFLKDRKFSVEDAVFKLTKAIKWRQDFGVSELTEDAVKDIAQTGKAFVHDFLDINERPVLVVVASKHFPKDPTADERLCTFLVEKALSKLPPGKEQILGIVDLRGFGTQNADIRYLTFLVMFFDCLPIF
ncbi:hypothetical protein TanjilG_31475 [Lupinus angustifolius]|uniref:UBX domain-containing protein n=1 Tax=Lupinus angustifolius TaxID=3871 RepID=A0A4P1RTQ7_LUPAN|nr:hypothetical protein TanjilG_31475 [Lupinus angustifolius]